MCAPDSVQKQVLFQILLVDQFLKSAVGLLLTVCDTKLKFLNVVFHEIAWFLDSHGNSNLFGYRAFGNQIDIDLGEPFQS